MIQPGQLVESHKFWEVAALWAAERVESERVVARALARGVIVDGLLRAEALEHLLAVVRQRQPLPAFWFAERERQA